MLSVAHFANTERLSVLFWSTLYIQSVPRSKHTVSVRTRQAIYV